MSRRFLLCLLGVAFAAEHALVASHAQVAFKVREGASEVRGEPVIIRFGACGGPADVLAEHRLTLPGELLVPSGEANCISIASELFWSEVPSIRSEERDGGVVEIFVWPRATFRASFVGDDVNHLDAASLRFFHPRLPRSEEELGIPEPGVDCDVTKGVLACDGPGGQWDLLLKAEGYAPVFFWGFQVDDKGVVDLGEIRLVKGATVVGHVRQGEGVEFASFAKPIQATLIPRFDHSASLTTAEHLADVRKRALVTNVGTNGAFQFTGVPLGAYDLVIESPGLSRTDLKLLIAGSRLYDLSDVELHRSVAQYTIRIVPALDPHGLPWTVWLRGENDPQASLESLSTEATQGVALFEDLSTGKYLASIVDSQRSLWGHRPLDVRPDSETEALIALSPPVAIVGTVVLGDDPLPAEVRFTMREKNTLRVMLEADEAGRFVGALPKEGKWQVSIEEELRMWRLPEPIEVAAGDQSRFTLEIKLPSSVVVGRVINPFAGDHRSDIEVRQDDGKALFAAKSDADGHFELRGLEAGEYSISARAENSSSVSERISVEEDQIASPITLVLKPLRELRGAVKTASGEPVLDAIVLTAGGRRASAHTDVDGTFNVNVDDAGRAMLVTAPGLPVRITKIPENGISDINLFLGDVGGALELALDEFLAIALANPADYSLTLEYEGAQVSHRDLFAVTNPVEHGTSLTIPNLEPGTYIACMVASSAQQCQTGQVVADGTTTVQFPEPGEEGGH